MNTVTLVVTVLVCLNAVQGLSLIKRGQSCDEYMTSCAAPLIRYGNVLDERNLAADLHNDTLVDELCSHLSSFTICASNAGSVCAGEIEGLEPLLDGAVDIIQYMCTSEGRTLLREMAQSPCATNDNVLEDLEREFQVCTETFQLEATLVMMEAMENNVADPFARVCSLVDNFRSCSVEGTRALCGDAFATFVARLWDTFSSALMSQQGLDCSTHIRAPQMVRRALGIMKRHA